MALSLLLQSRLLVAVITLIGAQCMPTAWAVADEPKAGTLLRAAERNGDREREARRLFVKAARLPGSKSCAKRSEIMAAYSFIMGKAGLAFMGKEGLALIERSGLLAEDLSEKDFKVYIVCLRKQREAAVIHQRLLSDYPETEAAFRLANRPIVLPADIDKTIVRARKRREEKQRSVSELLTLLEKPAKPSKSRDKNQREVNQIERVPKETAKSSPPQAPLSALDRRLAAKLAQLVTKQISPCWSMPWRAKDIQNIQIEIHILLKPNGTLRGAPRIGDQARMRSDPFFRAAAESAVRALRDPACSPLKLPVNTHDVWKEITLIFDPREFPSP